VDGYANFIISSVVWPASPVGCPVFIDSCPICFVLPVAHSQVEFGRRGRFLSGRNRTHVGCRTLPGLLFFGPLGKELRPFPWNGVSPLWLADRRGLFFCTAGNREWEALCGSFLRRISFPPSIFGSRRMGNFSRSSPPPLFGRQGLVWFSSEKVGLAFSVGTPPRVGPNGSRWRKVASGHRPPR